MLELPLLRRIITRLCVMGGTILQSRAERASSQSRAVLTGLLAASLITATAFWWLCARNDSIAFLPAKRGAEWIVYPKPVEGGLQPAFPISVIFQRSFTLGTPHTKAIMTLRAFRNASVTINNQAVALPSFTRAGWKSPATVDVTDWLRVGTNVLQVWVTNAFGPPALWLQLQAGADSVATDQSWQVSLAQAAWQQAWLAKRSLEAQPGDPFRGGERTLDSVKRIWPAFAGCCGLSLIVVWLVERLCRRRKQSGPGGRTLTPNQWLYCLLALVLVARAVLFFHNQPLLRPNMGFDAEAHEQYVRFIQEKHALPLPNDGWEMHQAPLYYASGALLLGVCGMSADSNFATTLLRAFNGVIGLVHCWLIWLCLRRLFFRKISRGKPSDCWWAPSSRSISIFRNTSRMNPWPVCS